MSLALRHFAIGVVTLIVALVAYPRSGVASPPADVAWAAPGDARVVHWGADGVVTELRTVSLESSSQLSPDELLLVPVEPGEVWRVLGDGRLGLATGAGETPDAITWWPTPGSDITVPTWSSARFLAVRAKARAGASVQLFVARSVSDPFAWYRFDEAVARWLFDGEPLGLSPPREAAAALRALEATERALSTVERPLRAPWLMARWLELSLRLRPLVSPYFARSNVSPRGGTAPVPATNGDSAVLLRQLTAGQELVFPNDGSDVIRLEVQPASGSSTRIQIFEGDTLARSVEMSAKNGAAPRALNLRAVVPVDSAGVRLRLVEGSAVVRFEAFSQRNRVLDGLSRRLDRRRDWAVARSSRTGRAPAWLVRLADAGALATQGSCRQLRASGRPRPEVGALLALEGSRCEASLAAVLVATLSFRQQLDSLPLLAQAPLERAVLERLVDAGGKRIDIDGPRARGGTSDDRIASDALVAGLASVPDAGASQSAELAVESSAERRDLIQLARRAWLRGTVWGALPPRAPTTSVLEAQVPEDDADLPGRCTVQTGAGLRWTVLDSSRSELVVGPSGGTHSHVLLRLTPGDDRELALTVGGVPITVHGGAGLFGHVALAPGAYRVEVPQGSTFLARAPRAGAAACGELRDLERWTLLRGSLTFDAAPSDVGQPARVTVKEASLGGRARALVIASGGDQYTSWIRPPATGALEIPRARSSRLTVQGDAALWLRASVRRPLAAPPAVRAATHHPALVPASEQLLLQRLRLATRRLQVAADPQARSSAHGERADLLTSLGAGRLADIEQLRAAIEPTATEPPDAEGALSLRFSDLAPAALALGVASKIPPLLAVADGSTLERARALDAAGEPPIAVTEALQSSAAASSGVDALLLANAAERARRPQLAALAYERIARATGSGAAFARAATLFADSSAAGNDPRLAFQGYLLARRAIEQGDPALDALGRLAPAVSWLSASSAGSDNGSLPLVHTGTATESLGARIRRALLDADADAVLLADDRRLELLSDQPLPSELSVNIRCLAVEATGNCRATLRVDGATVACPGLDLAETSLSTHCPISLPAGKHRVELAPSTAGGSVMAALVTSGKDVIAPRVVSTWTETDPQYPLEFRVFGPTVLRLVARGAANESQTIALELASAGKSERRLWPITGSADAAVKRLGQDSDAPPEFAAEAEYVWVVERPGEQRLRLTVERPHTLLRLYSAYGSGVARSRAGVEAPNPPVELAESTQRYQRHLPIIGEAVAEGPLTLSASMSVESTDVTDLEGDRTDFRGEYRVSVRRELWRSQLYASAAVLYRSRNGSDSRAALFEASSRPRGPLPGAFARGSVIQQTLRTGVETGLRGALGILWDLPLTPHASLVPWAEVIGRKAPRLRDVTSDVDSDLYTIYARSQPVSLISGLRVDARPFVDALASYGLSARFSPESTALDRADAVASVDALPGDGLWPWLRVWGVVSYRPLSAIRQAAFTRTSLGAELDFFAWSRGSERWSLFGRLVEALDWPAGSGTLSFTLGISVDETFQRGLRDYAPRDTPFRGRQEEGSARTELRRPASDAPLELAR